MFVLCGIFSMLTVFTGVSLAEPVGTYFYEDLGCAKEDAEPLHYKCPDFSFKNDTCLYKTLTLKSGENLSEDLLKGSCHHCFCRQGGRIVCATEDCFQRFKTGCSHFRYSLDRCCPVETVCDPKIECEIEGKKYKEGMSAYLKNSCDVCICDEGFKQEAPFCKRRTCYDQLRHQSDVSNFGAPVFFKDENCCPTTWVSVEEDRQITKISANAPASSAVSCKYGNKKVDLGYGFKTSIQPYGTLVQLTCECTIPPYVICREE